MMLSIGGFLSIAVTALGSGAAPASSPVAARPQIVQRPIPFGADRKREMAAYSKRHYGVRAYHLRRPRVIVEHYTVSTTLSSAYNTFAANERDPELHELPGVCAHFIVDRDGTIVQLVSLKLRCRHTIGLNHRAIGIEQVGMNAQEILGRKRQRRSIVRLTAWLRCRYDIRQSDIIGHAMSLSSPFHEERVAALRNRTHADWTASELAPIRREIARYHC